MYKLLEKQEQIKFNILKFLENSVDQIISIDDIALEIGLSQSKTSEIVDELVTTLDNHFSLTNENRPLFRNNYNELIKGPNFSTDAYFKYFLKTSIYYELLTDLFYDKSISLETYAEKRNISVSTVMRFWRNLKDVITSFNMKIIKKDGKFLLVGEEEHIRYFFFMLFKDSGKKFPAVLQTQHFKFNRDDVSLPVPQTQIHMMNLMLNISLIRTQKQHLIEKEVDYFYIMSRLLDEEKFNTIFYPFFNKQLSKHVIEKECAFFYFYVATWTVIEKDLVTHTNSYIVPDFINHRHFKVSNELIYKIIHIFQLAISPDDYFYLLINLIIAKRKLEVFGNLADVDINLEGFSTFQSFKQLIFSQIDFKTILSAEQLFLIFYPLLQKNKEPIKLMLISRYGMENQRLFEKKLGNLLERQTIFVNSVQSQPEIIVSDYLFEFGETPIVYLPPFPSNIDLEKAASLISSIKENKNSTN